MPKTSVTARRSPMQQLMDRFVPRDDGSSAMASEARPSMDRFVPRDDGSSAMASEARPSMDRFVPRDDGSNVMASEIHVSRLCERSAAIYISVIASAARQSMLPASTKHPPHTHNTPTTHQR